MISRFVPAFAAAVLLVWAVAAGAQGVDLGGRDSSAPISVTADAFTGDFQTKVGVYSGNVIVSQGTFKLHADQVQVAVAKGKPNRIEAVGHVLFDAPSGTASGDRGIYDLSTRTIALTGDVLLTKDKNVMRGTSLVVDLDSGKARLSAKGMEGGRVQGLFTPPPKRAAKGAAKGADGNSSN